MNDFTLRQGPRVILFNKTQFQKCITFFFIFKYNLFLLSPYSVAYYNSSIIGFNIYYSITLLNINYDNIKYVLINIVGKNDIKIYINLIN